MKTKRSAYVWSPAEAAEVKRKLDWEAKVLAGIRKELPDFNANSVLDKFDRVSPGLYEELRKIGHDPRDTAKIIADSAYHQYQAKMIALSGKPVLTRDDVIALRSKG